MLVCLCGVSIQWTWYVGPGTAPQGRRRLYGREDDTPVQFGVEYETYRVRRDAVGQWGVGVRVGRKKDSKAEAKTNLGEKL